jgi:hypothetical protein
MNILILSKSLKNVLMCLSALLVMLTSNIAIADMQFLSSEDFLKENFANGAPKQKVLWLSKADIKQAESILGHAPLLLRQRYWQEGNKTVWVLEEIGKEEPITAGFVIDHNKIAQVRVLTYRESRGWEVRYPSFLKQFVNAVLKEDTQLSQSIDGISGATLSVSAMKRMARLALYFDTLSNKEI